MRTYRNQDAVGIICLLIVALFGIANYCFGQTDEEIFNLDWKVGQEVSIYGNTILRLEGENKIEVTNIAYENHHQIYGDQSSELYEKRAAIGGKIELFITGRTRDSNYFTVIVKDINEKELLRWNLAPKQFHKVENGLGWRNSESISLPEYIRKPFFIYVIDSLAKENDSFKFEVTKKEPLEGDKAYAYDYVYFTQIYSLFDTINLRELKGKKFDKVTFQKLKDRKELLRLHLRESYEIDSEQLFEKETFFIGLVKSTYQYYGVTYIEIDIPANIKLTENIRPFEEEDDKVLYKIVANRKFIESEDCFTNH